MWIYVINFIYSVKFNMYVIFFTVKTIQTNICKLISPKDRTDEKRPKKEMQEESSQKRQDL